MIKAVLLDLFGTVVAYGDTEAGTREAWEGIHAALRRLGANPPYEAFAADWQAQFLTPLRPEEDTEETPFLSKVLRLFRSYGLPEDRGAALRGVNDCIGAWDRHLALPGDAVPALRALRERHAVALVSNFDHPPYVRRLLARLDLARHFDVILISGELRIDKPDPRIFQAALDAVGCAPAEALFVGDSLEADIAGAEAVGCRSVLIDMQGRHPDYSGERITSLSELAPLLASGRSSAISGRRSAISC